MKIIKAKYEIINKENIKGLEILKGIELVGRTCYKSENNITDDSAKKFVANLIKSGHEAMIEHNAISVRFTCDRGISHELVRHRLASFGQESTRYCNYAKDKFGGEISVIGIHDIMRLEVGKTLKNQRTGEEKTITVNDVMVWIQEWELAMEDAEKHYMDMIDNWCPAQLARSVLPNSLKTEIVVTMNLREWRHFFSLRADTPAHPQMRELAIPLLKEMSELIPIVFDDLVEKLLNK